MTFRSCAVIASLLSATLCQAAPIYYLATGQTGAQTQIDVNHSSSWTLIPNVAFDLGGGLFVMKDGSSTTQTLMLSIYQGTNTSGTLVDTVTLNHTQFCAQVTNCGQFDVHSFLFSSPVPLTIGTTYFVQLTSTAPDVQSQAYFIKSDFYFISDAAGTPIQPEPVGFGGGTAVPEISSVWMFALGITATTGMRAWSKRLKS